MRRPIAGGTWTPDTAGLGTVSNFTAMGPDRAGRMMGESGFSLYRRNAGVWFKMSLPSQAVSNFWSPDRFSVDSSGAIFLAFTNFQGGRGVYFSSDTGATWTFAGLDSIAIYQLVSYGDTTYACTNNGLYALRRQAYGTAGVLNGSVQPKTFTLFQNYPNPFNPVTFIGFELPVSSNVKLVVYDLLDREVSTLVNGSLPAGHYQARWNGERMSSGVYFYRLTAGNFSATKKLVLMK